MIVDGLQVAGTQRGERRARPCACDNPERLRAERFRARGHAKHPSVVLAPLVARSREPRARREPGRVCQPGVQGAVGEYVNGLPRRARETAEGGKTRHADQVAVQCQRSALSVRVPNRNGRYCPGVPNCLQGGLPFAVLHGWRVGDALPR